MRKKLKRITNWFVLLLALVLWPLWPGSVVADSDSDSDSDVIGMDFDPADLDIIAEVHEPQLEHVTQAEINAAVADDPLAGFLTTFFLGDELFEQRGNELDGLGVNVGNGEKSAKFPRMDLDGPKQWASQFPPRVTGPNGNACDACHNIPTGDGSGEDSSNNIRDPKRTGDPAKWIKRQPPHVFGLGANQLLAQEMTKDLRAIRDAAIAKAVDKEKKIKKKLKSKGVKFGKITAHPDGTVDYSKVEGVDHDLKIKPYEWKGVTATVREFMRGAAHNELGLEPQELVGWGVDNDFDGVVNEFGVGRVTALTVYQAFQPRPLTKTELADIGQLTMTTPERESIERGKELFKQVKCASCHIPMMKVSNPVFSEPSQYSVYRDAMFPSGDNPLDHGLSPDTAVKFNMTTDSPDNIFETDDGEVNLGNFKTKDGKMIVEAFTDYKRHYMGEYLKEAVDETGHGAAAFMTRALWGVGSTPPYMHDGRSPTLTGAILTHGVEAKKSRQKFIALSTAKKADLIAYLNDRIIHKEEEEE